MRTRAELLRKQAHQNDMSVAQLQKIVGHQFKYLSNMMRSGIKKERLELPYFGKFQPNHRIIKKLEEYAERTNQDRCEDKDSSAE